MDAIIQSNIKLIAERKKKTWPWILDERYDQSYFTFFDGAWIKAEARSSVLDTFTTVTRLTLHSWNIDFMLPFSDSRMQVGVIELQSLIENSQKDGSHANVIFLQECLESDLKVIRAHPWIQGNFVITDLDCEHWASDHYGTTTLIDKRLVIASTFRVHYSHTRMERDALFVDVRCNGKIVRFCNTHLESLALDPPYRPLQMQTAARFMQEKPADAAILAGDLNAIQEFDSHLHSDNGLKDAYLEFGGSERDSEGHTWGQQAASSLREQFGTSRMDKVFFCGGLKLEIFEKFGADVLLSDQTEQSEIVQLGFEKAWITDHLGVKATFEVENNGS